MARHCAVVPIHAEKVLFRVTKMLSAMQSPKIKGPLIAGLVVLAAAIITGLAFAGWLNHAPGIFLVLAQNGLAWCF